MYALIVEIYVVRSHALNCMREYLFQKTSSKLIPWHLIKQISGWNHLERWTSQLIKSIAHVHAQKQCTFVVFALTCRTWNSMPFLKVSAFDYGVIHTNFHVSSLSHIGQAKLMQVALGHHTLRVGYKCVDHDWQSENLQSFNESRHTKFTGGGINSPADILG